VARGDLAGSAQLELVSGVAQLHREDAMFDAMLRGFRASRWLVGFGRRPSMAGRAWSGGLRRPPTITRGTGARHTSRSGL